MQQIPEMMRMVSYSQVAKLVDYNIVDYSLGRFYQLEIEVDYVVFCGAAQPSLDFFNDNFSRFDLDNSCVLVDLACKEGFCFFQQPCVVQRLYLSFRIFFRFDCH